MQIYGLVGPSGTGKSHRAERVARQVGAQIIIDDGLLIHGGRVAAGFSAKFEPNRIAAVKRAIFTDEEHRRQVAERIRQLAPNTVLVLGTSTRMVETICRQLGLEGPITFIPIETVAELRHRDLAANLRRLGMHAIPVTPAQLEIPRFQQFLRRLRYRLHTPRTPATGPTPVTVVNAAFSGGAIYIHPRVVRDVVIQLARQEGHPFSVRTVRTRLEDQVTVHVHVRAMWQPDIPGAARRLLRDIRTYLEDNLGFSDPELILHVDSVHPPGAAQETGSPDAHTAGVPEEDRTSAARSGPAASLR
ncbi:hypothetical protein [Alicyclobacillus macrosporangiidus]|uniref:Asp23 family, cell envelope-related function n=1 Tax=Alicyclobacillus macrosporangiidus TaxID=392015 RepID=A0A1I7KIP8_9BACL|nr:hypothetical protein [Alicyclobacillus macrosporangiidus]SFU97318.1 hypothetical protein SAMN05421543_11649 [Alicyclobacillus macrosporangiidus]